VANRPEDVESLEKQYQFLSGLDSSVIVLSDEELTHFTKNWYCFSKLSTSSGRLATLIKPEFWNWMSIPVSDEELTHLTNGTVTSSEMAIYIPQDGQINANHYTTT
jgi:glycine oxidase